MDIKPHYLCECGHSFEQHHRFPNMSANVCGGCFTDYAEHIKGRKSFPHEFMHTFKLDNLRYLESRANG